MDDYTKQLYGDYKKTSIRIPIKQLEYTWK